jgi:SAM-dependent methyltransferase
MSHVSFDHVASAYDEARPDYPGELYDVLESALGQPLLRAEVLDVGAGTGIATRALAGRGARVVALDPGPAVLAVLRSRSTSRVRTVVADGNALPLRDEVFDLVTYAQAFHWTDPDRSVPEAARVLHDRGVLATWWNLLRADGQEWFEDYAAVVEERCPGYDRRQRDIDWGAKVEEAGRFAWVRMVEIPWTRTVTAESFVVDQSSHSYVAALPPEEQSALLDGLRNGLARAFPGGRLALPYVTRLWVARR